MKHNADATQMASVLGISSRSVCRHAAAGLFGAAAQNANGRWLFHEIQAEKMYWEHVSIDRASPEMLDRYDAYVKRQQKKQMDFKNSIMEAQANDLALIASLPIDDYQKLCLRHAVEISNLVYLDDSQASRRILQAHEQMTNAAKSKAESQSVNG